MKAKSNDDGGVKRSVIRDLPNSARRVFAVGDIHGHADEIGALLDYLVDSKGLNAEDQLVFIGDYIDRGGASNRVIERMLEVKRTWPNSVFLKGNHEDMLLSFLGLGGSNGEFYLENGGATFFRSYGIDAIGSLSAIREKLPESHLTFLRGLELGVATPGFIFVHAGLSPQRELNQQTDEDMLWIREEFVLHPHPFGKTVVFGHTAFNQVFVDLPYRIGIDTGAAYGNKLSAVELVQGEVFQVAIGERVVSQSLITTKG